MKQIHLHDNILTIKVEEIPAFVKIVLTLFLCICAFMPILVAYFLFYSGLTIGIIISFAFFWTIGFFGLRYLLWNNYGKEVLHFNTEKISYHADFRLFTDKEYSINNKNVCFYISEELDGKSRLIIKNETEEIETSIKILNSELTPLIVEMEKFQTKD